jgi:anti-anti-sigma factor
MARLDVDTRTEDGIAVVAPRGELDVAGTPELDDAVAAVVEEPGVRGVVIDLSGLEFLDSSGLRAIVLAHRHVEDCGLRFALVRGGEPVHRVFDITRMTDRLPWVASPGELIPDSGELR